MKSKRISRDLFSIRKCLANYNNSGIWREATEKIMANGIRTQKKTALSKKRESNAASYFIMKTKLTAIL